MTSLLDKLRTTQNLNSAWLSVRSNVLMNGNRESKSQVDTLQTNTPSYIRKIQTQLRTGYKFTAGKGSLKIRPKKQPRPIVISQINDRIVLRAILNILQTTNPKTRYKLGDIPNILSTPTSVGGIPRKGVSDAITLIKEAIANGSQYYITSDIKDFFRNIQRESVVEYISLETGDKDFADFFHRTRQKISGVKFSSFTRIATPSHNCYGQLSAVF